jgi:hypothetical protein
MSQIIDTFRFRQYEATVVFTFNPRASYFICNCNLRVGPFLVPDLIKKFFSAALIKASRARMSPPADFPERTTVREESGGGRRRRYRRFDEAALNIEVIMNLIRIFPQLTLIGAAVLASSCGKSNSHTPQDGVADKLAMRPNVRPVGTPLSVGNVDADLAAVLRGICHDGAKCTFLRETNCTAFPHKAEDAYADLAGPIGTIKIRTYSRENWVLNQVSAVSLEGFPLPGSTSKSATFLSGRADWARLEGIRVFRPEDAYEEPYVQVHMKLPTAPGESTHGFITVFNQLVRNPTLPQIHAVECSDSAVETQPRGVLARALGHRPLGIPPEGLKCDDVEEFGDPGAFGTRVEIVPQGAGYAMSMHRYLGPSLDTAYDFKFEGVPPVSDASTLAFAFQEQEFFKRAATMTLMRLGDSDVPNFVIATVLPDGTGVFDGDEVMAMRCIRRNGVNDIP